MHPDPVELDIPRPDGTLRVLRWGRGRPARGGPARHHRQRRRPGCRSPDALPTEWSLFAVDLRGRGHSAELPGPYGFDRHITDVLDARSRTWAWSCPVLTGHSLGAYLALLVFDRAPGPLRRAAAGGRGAAAAGPRTARTWTRCWTPAWAPRWPGCARRYPSVDGVLRLLAGAPGPEGRLERVTWRSTLRYDLTGVDGVLRSRVSEEAARADGRELLGCTARGSVPRCAACPARPGCSPRPRACSASRPGLLPPELCETWAAAGADAH